LIESDCHVVHVEYEFSQIAEEKAEDHQNQNSGQICFAFVVSGWLKKVWKNKVECLNKISGDKVNFLANMFFVSF
jgi:hypothetical protein